MHSFYKCLLYFQFRVGEEHAPYRTPQGACQHPQSRGSHQTAETGSRAAGRLWEWGGGAQSKEPEVENFSKTKAFICLNGFTSISHLNPPTLCPLVLRTSLQSQTAICQRMKERLAIPRRREWKHRKDVPGLKKERKMTHSTSWILKFPRES